MYRYDVAHVTVTSFKRNRVYATAQWSHRVFFSSRFSFPCRLQEMEILYKKEKEEADLLLEQQRLVGVHPESSVGERAACSRTFPVPRMSMRPHGLLSSHWYHTLFSPFLNGEWTPGTLAENLSIKVQFCAFYVLKSNHYFCQNQVLFEKIRELLW